jgi:hypothetical protein
MQHDGNLVVYHSINGITATWASHTDAPENQDSHLFAQNDGNFVLVNKQGVVTWSSDTWKYPGTILKIQEDGNLVAYAPGNNAIWSIQGGNTTKHGLAFQLLNNPGVKKTGRLVFDDLQKTAAGNVPQGGYEISTTILHVLIELSKNHSFEITAMESGGTGHSAGSRHYTGDAVDIDQLDGVSVTGRNDPSITIINSVVPMLPSGSGFGQSNCGKTPPLPSGIVTFADTCNHLHIEVPRNTA